jgi:hypothetical protein
LSVLLAVGLALMCQQDDLDAKVQAMMPLPEEERWTLVPWRTNLAEARLESLRERKPIFAWIMNGHPFGCT